MEDVTKKHKEFVREPMGNKLVTTLPGVGPVVGKKLRQQGFDKANKVFGQFLLLDRDTEMFIEWFRPISLANSRQAEQCANCLKEWSDNFL